ncbi:unnamed protein product, partial [Didymodactylos carnosus]
FRFLRAIRMMNIPDILQYMGVIQRPRSIRFIQVASKFIAVGFAAAGAVHLIRFVFVYENTVGNSLDCVSNHGTKGLSGVHQIQKHKVVYIIHY